MRAPRHEDAVVDEAPGETRPPRRYVASAEVGDSENSAVSSGNAPSLRQDTSENDPHQDGTRHPDDTWHVAGFDVFSTRVSPLRRKRVPLTPNDFDCDGVAVARTLREARGGADVGSAHRDPPVTNPNTTRVPLQKLVPGNKTLHRKVAQVRGLLSNEMDLSPGVTTSVGSGSSPSDSALGVKSRLIAHTATPDAVVDFSRSAVDFSPSFSIASTSSAWSAERTNVRPSPSSAIDESRHYVANNETNETAAETAETAAARDARRRHRKRLAKIVVSQWRFFAGDALECLPGTMHQRWRVKNNVLKQWHRVAVEESSLAALRQVAAARTARLAKTVAAFQERSDAMRREELLPVDVDDIFGGMTDTQPTQDESTATSTSTRVFASEAAALLVTRWRRWRRFTLRSVTKKTRGRVLDSMAAARCASRGRKLRKAILGHWRAYATARTARRIYKTKIVNSVTKSIGVNRERRNFTLWRDTVVRQRVIDAINEARHVRTRRTAVSRNAFLSWRDFFVKPRVRVKTFSAALRKKRNASSVEKAWRSWVFRVPDLRADRLLVRDVWSEWTSEVTHCRWRVAKAETFRVSLEEKKKLAVFRDWRLVTTDQIRDAKLEFRLRKFATGLRVKWLRNGFRDGFLVPLQRARRNKAADTQALRYLSGKALRVWVRFLARRVSKKTKNQGSISFHKKRSLHSAWRAWSVIFITKQRKQQTRTKKITRALATRRALISCRAFIGWSYQSKVVGRAKRRVVRGTRRDFSPKSGTHGFAVNAPVTVRTEYGDGSDRLLRRFGPSIPPCYPALCTPKLVTVVHTLPNKWTDVFFFLLVDAVRFRRAFLAARAFSAWRVVFDETRALNALCETKLLLITRTLVALKQARGFGEWVEWTKKSLARTAVTNVATALRKQTLRMRFLSAWRFFVTENVANRAQCEVSEKHSQKHLTYTAVEAWVTYLVRRREKAGLKHKACEFAKKSRCQKTVAALRDFAEGAYFPLTTFRRLIAHTRLTLSAFIVSVKIKARTRLADAIEQHRVGLLRLGCGAWLREGFRRREVRVSFLANKMVHETAGKTALVWHSVAKFASRWLRTTRRCVGNTKTRNGGIRGMGNQCDTGYEYPKPVGVEPFLAAVSGAFLSSVPSTAVRSQAPSTAAPVPSTAASIDTTAYPQFAAPPKRNRPPARRGDFHATARLTAHTTPTTSTGAAASKPPVTRPPLVPSSGRENLSDQTGYAYEETSYEPSRFTPEALDKHERLISEYESLKAESDALRKSLVAIDKRLADGQISQIAGDIKKELVQAACVLLTNKRKALLPLVRKAAFALGEARSDLASTVAGW